MELIDHIVGSVHEGARDLGGVIADEDEWLASRRERKKVEMLFAHLKRIMRLDRLRFTRSQWRP